MYNETTRLVKVVMPVDTEEDIQQGETNPILASVNPTRAAGDSDAIMLSDTAENLFIAYEVVAMVKDESTGKTHFSQLKWKRLGAVEEEDGGDAKSVADPNGDGDGEPIVAKGAMRDGSDTSDDDASDEEQLYYQFMFESGDLFVAAAADEYPELDGDELQMLNDSSSGGGSGSSTGGGVLVVQSTVTGSGDNEVHTLDKTWKEIADAGYAVVHEQQTYDGVSADFYGIITAIINMDPYTISVFFRAVGQAGTTLYYETDAEDGYPVSATIS